MFILIYLAIIIAVVYFPVYNYKKNVRVYEKTDYYKMTHNPYATICSNKGKRGEYNTYRVLSCVEGYKRFLFNCYILKDDGTTTEVDIIMIHSTGIYVIESKNYNGWIFGRESNREWTQTLPRRNKKAVKSHFFNPIMQNNVHIKWLKPFLKDLYVYDFHSYIVFGPNCALKSINLDSDKHRVVTRNELLRDIRKVMVKMDEILSKEEMDCIYNKLYPLTQVDESVKLQHIENIKANYDEERAIERTLICPRCNGKLVIRQATKGSYIGERFYGCSNFPDCRYTKNIDKNKLEV